MSREFKVIPPMLSEKASEKPPIDWNVCVLCQKVTTDDLVHPSRGKRFEKGTGYRTFAEELQRAVDLKYNPLQVHFPHLDYGSGIEETLRKHEAVWHKLCKQKYSSLKLDRCAKHKNAGETSGESSSPVKTRRIGIDKPRTLDICLFCDGSDGELHIASTFGIDKTVRQYAVELSDTKLLRKIAGGDMVAIDAKYHKQCLSNLYHRARSARTSTSADDSDMSSFHSIALAELVAHIEENKFSEDTAPVFRLADMASSYKQRLIDLGIDPEFKVNTTRLKERLLSYCPYLSAKKQGRDILLVVDIDIGEAILKACTVDSDIICLAKAATIVREHIFHSPSVFSESSDGEDQTGNKTTPNALLALVNMILDGPSIKDQLEKSELSTNAGLAISQLLVFNSVVKREGSYIRHHRARETAMPVYVGLKLHTETRKRELIDRFHNLGMCISYDRVLSISAAVGDSVCKQYEKDGVVCPPQLRKGVFTTGQGDNIDHNPSAITAKDSFHGTAHSLCQHPTEDNPGEERERVSISNTGQAKRIPQLPQAYTTIAPAQPLPKNIHVPTSVTYVNPPTDEFVEDRKSEYAWLKKQMELCSHDDLGNNDWISWAAYHAARQREPPGPVTEMALLPLFREKSNTVAMIMHIMKTNAAAIGFLNPGQTPVLALDQPLYAIAKQVQWKYPLMFGENKYVMMLGGLHTEMAALKTIGDFLDGSGWVDALTEADIASAGTAESFLHASHITKTRRAHQVTAGALYQLQQKAYSEYSNLESHQEESLDFPEWCSLQSISHPQFHYWSIVLNFELTILQFVRSLRQSNFVLYTASMAQLAPWFFVLDHTNYARWLPIHIRDMVTLEDKCQDVHAKFTRGAFTAKKTARSFSAISLDQAHEQVNAMVKGEGGAVGLTEHPGALRRWMVAGPEIARMVSEFENGFGSRKNDSKKHHEQTKHTQEQFSRDVRSLVTTIEQMGNPFMEESKDLLNLNSKVIMPEKVINTIRKIEDLGKSQYEAYIEECLRTGSKLINATIRRNNLPLFSRPSTEKSKVTGKVSQLKNDRALFSRLYIASQRREGDLAEFFRHENQPAPPSLSDKGNIRHGDKYHLIECLERDITIPDIVPPVSAKIFDGPAVVHYLPPGTARTFGEYASEVFIPYVVRELNSFETSRVDLVWDVYLDDSLKAHTRGTRGEGTRRRVASDTRVPGNWPGFLRNDENKKELFGFLAQKCAEYNSEGKSIISTIAQSVVCSVNDMNLQGLQPCTQEEADTRIMLHVRDAAQSGHEKVMIRSVDTDVAIIAISCFHLTGLLELWLAFGTGQKFRCIAIHEIVANLGPAKSTALSFFHAFTGCDTVSFFANRGKKSAWQTWLSYPEVTDTFVKLSMQPEDITDDLITRLQRFVVLLYDRTCVLDSVDEARMYLFTKRSREIENIPPTAAALKEHIMRAAYQAGHIWGQALTGDPTIPSPSDYGWKKQDGRWVPIWTKRQEAAKACYELLCCHCKSACKGNCKCFKAHLQCTALCGCDGQCFED